MPAGFKLLVLAGHSERCASGGLRMLRLRFHCVWLVTVFTIALSDLALDAAAQEMRMHCIDVGQGASDLFEFPCGAVLIDTGASDDEHVGKLINYLTGFFARRTDLHDTLSEVIITHPHKDHTMGLRKVVESFVISNYV